MAVTYTPGQWYAVVGEPAVALLAPTAPAALVETVWAALAAGGGVPAVVQAVSAAYGGDFSALPSFVVVAPQRAGVLLAVRGPSHVRVRTAAGEVDASGAEVTTWSERWVAEPVAVEVVADGLVTVNGRDEAGAGGGAGGPGSLPVRSGVVLAGRVRVGLDGGAGASSGATAAAVAPRHGAPSPAAPAVPGPSPARLQATPAPPAMEETIVDPDAVETEHPGVAAAPAEQRDPRPRVSLAKPPLPVGGARPATRPGLTPDPTAVLGVGAGRVPEGPLGDSPGAVDTGYDHLWGRTVLRSVEDAAIREGQEPTAEASSPGPLIAEVPGVPDPYAADHDGQTILRPRPAPRPVPRHAPPAPPPPAAPGGTASTGPSVLARVCPAGHPNPPQAAQCRDCGAALTQDAVRVPRPPLGTARLSSGEVLVLDTPAVLGRSPRVGRVAGGDVPRPVTVPSPTREVSGTHLAIRLEEWHVLVADLGSANGTILRRPGQPPQRLHPREPALVFSGDVVDLGDGVTVAFEGLP